MSFDYQLVVEKDLLPQAPAAVQSLAGGVVRKTVFDIESSAKRRAPVDTGALRNSIKGEMVGDVSGLVSVGVEYGHDVEYGTRKQAAQPYLGPAVEESRVGFESAMAQILDPSSWGI